MARRRSPNAAPPSPKLDARGGTYAPVLARQAEAIADAALDILTGIGLSEAPEDVATLICGRGGRVQDSRLIYPLSLVEEMLETAPRNVLLAGQDEVHDMRVGGTSAYVGTGGAAPNVWDREEGAYRPSTLRDLSDAARLTDALPHIQFFARSLVARDMNGARALDLNTAFVSLAGTTKHVMVQATLPGHVAQIAAMAHALVGGEAAFRARPVLSLNINHIVPPLRFHDESMAVMAEAVRHGIPVHCNVFGQLGASSPVTLAGSVAQTLAETLAGMAFVHALRPGAPAIAGPRPMITDLRTGGFSGGSGEQALATAVCAQVLRMWDLPCSVIAGATDAKRPDAQAGYEKAMTVNSAVQAGANLVTQAAGTQAGLMGVDFASMVIDNDMLGAVLRANREIEVTDDTLALEAIREVVSGEGHFLGRPETFARMKTDFLFPEIADRRSIDDWQAAGAPALEDVAAARAQVILAGHHPAHVTPEQARTLTQTYALAATE